jgi:hypothetical protein
MNCICCNNFDKCPLKSTPLGILIAHNSLGGIECDRYCPAWITPEEYHNRTGKEWPDDWAVYALYRDHFGNETWYCKAYEPAQYTKNNPILVICALDSGRPPIAYRREITSADFAGDLKYENGGFLGGSK